MLTYCPSPPFLCQSATGDGEACEDISSQSCSILTIQGFQGMHGSFISNFRRLCQSGDGEGGVIYYKAKRTNLCYLACSNCLTPNLFCFPAGTLLRIKAYSSEKHRLRRAREISTIAETMYPSYTFSTFFSLPQTGPRNA